MYDRGVKQDGFILWLHENIKETSLIDYKLLCFNGKVKCSFTCTERGEKSGLKVTFFDRDWKQMPFQRHYPCSCIEISKPSCYDKMLQLAEALAENIPFVRVDFYEVNNKIYFGELTFYPGAGFEEFTPFKWDEKLGSCIYETCNKSFF